MTATRQPDVSRNERDHDAMFATLRGRFPALTRDPSFLFFDNAAGAQVPQGVLDAVNHHLVNHNVQRGGRYGKSVAVDSAVAHARMAVADLINARDPTEVCFGMNATSFIRIVSLALGQTLGARDEIVVSEMDHDANVATWMALERMGAKIVFWRMRDDGLHVEDLAPLLSDRTRLVACTVVSHALGSIVDVTAAARLAHAAGAEIFLDCVHYTPHALVDVQAWECDYMVCSGYKAFAPHMGFLWGRREKLIALPTFREDFIPDEPPYKVEAGTFIYENVSGMAAAVAYLEGIGADLPGNNDAGSRRDNIVRAMTAIRAYERTLSRTLLGVLQTCGATVYGIGDPGRTEERVPTFSFTLPGHAPAAVVERMAEAGIGIRDGHMYTPRLMRRLGVSPETGVIRTSLVHYNTVEEIGRFGDVLKEIVGHVG